MIGLTQTQGKALVQLIASLRRRPKHRHVWTYTSTIAGWTLARCACGAVELA